MSPIKVIVIQQIHQCPQDHDHKFIGKARSARTLYINKAKGYTPKGIQGLLQNKMIYVIVNK